MKSTNMLVVADMLFKMPQLIMSFTSRPRFFYEYT